ncbi:MAG TPA: M6 family metalloprotease domain-containing protein [Thermoanaerobaculaceae bacterium]|nr:M6 family metalloprotease domain-containing protein [Thermoanaerobaculaceae bacterium]
MRGFTRARRLHRWVVVPAALLIAAVVQGAFLRNVPQTVTQPNGTPVHLFATGDEYYNALHDVDGYVVIRDEDTGYFVYAVKVDGRLQPTAFVAGEADPRALGLEKGVRPDPRYLPDPEELYGVSRRLRVRALAAEAAPGFSRINNIVIFIRFADETSAGFNTLSTYQAWFNSTASSDASMQRYFLEASYSQLTVSSTFYPSPSGTAIASFQDSHNRSYFKPYDATSNPDGYNKDAPSSSTDSRDYREHTLLKSAVDAVSSQIPPALDVDTDGDGYVDNVVFVVSGTAVTGEWSNLLWPHRWALSSGYAVTTTINGKRVDDYNFQLDGNIEGSGVLCHEMTHTLGAPDLYHYSDCSSAENLQPVGWWDLMADNQEPPQHMGAYMKQRYLGWISQIPLISSSGTYQMNPLTSATGNSYRIASPNSSSEFFVLEYRKQSFPFENSVPGSGLVVYRLNTATGLRAGNPCGPPDEVYVYRPSGTPTANGNLRAANFSSDVARTAIDDTTNPSSFLSTGYPGGLSITNIGAAGSTISFTVNIQSACSKPGAFSLTAPANGASVSPSTQITLSWAASAGATSYDVYFGNDPTPGLLGNRTDTSVSVTVTVGNSYFWKVVAKNTCGEASAPAAGTWAFTAGGPGGVTILSDDFEGSFPGKWKVYGVQGHAGSAMWGQVSCRTNGGSGAVWCAGGGSPSQPACTAYIQDHGTFLIYGPFDLSDASEATVDFDAWYDINDGGDPDNATDWVAWLFSVDGKSFPTGDGATGTSQGWEHVSVKLSDMKLSDGSSLVGRAQVWLGFVFVSSATTTPREGAYIDNVVIKKVVGQSTPSSRKVRRHLPRR